MGSYPLLSLAPTHVEVELVCDKKVKWSKAKFEKSFFTLNPCQNWRRMMNSDLRDLLIFRVTGYHKHGAI